MKNERFYLISLLLLMGLGVLGSSVQPALARFGPAEANQAAGPQPSPEFWTAGVTLEGSPVYANAAGRLLTEAAAFRSNVATQDIYFAFPAPAAGRTVQSARTYLLRRTGAYLGDALLSLEVYGMDGTLKQIVSEAPLDLQAAPLDAWLEVPLSADPVRLELGPGDYLAFHFHLSAAADGDLDLRPIFDVLVQ